jgi:hypothetical protein
MRACPTQQSAATESGTLASGTLASGTLGSSAGNDPVGPEPGGAASKAGSWRRGNPRGNPGLNMAPRCRARARSGESCRSPAMANGRCRMHGGRSTGPATAEGMARMTAARTTHGLSTVSERARRLYVQTVVVRGRLYCAAMRLRAYLPAEMAARLAEMPAELTSPEHPSQLAFVASAAATPGSSDLGSTGGGHAPANGSRQSCDEPVRSGGGTARPGFGAGRPGAGRAVGTAGPALRGWAAERLAAQAEADARAPWRKAIAFARAAKRAARASTAKRARRAAGGTTRTARQDLMQQSATPLPATPGSPRDAPSGSSVWGQLECALRAARQNPMQQSATPRPAAPQHAIPQGATGPRGGGTEAAVWAGRSAPAPSAPGSPRDATSGSSVWGQLECALRAARQNPMQQSASPGPAAPQHVLPQDAARQAATGPRHGDGAGRRERCGWLRPRRRRRAMRPPGRAFGRRRSGLCVPFDRTPCNSLPCRSLPCRGPPWRSLQLGRGAVGRAGSGVVVRWVGCGGERRKALRFSATRSSLRRSGLWGRRICAHSSARCSAG